MIDMTKWEQIAARQIHHRKKTTGRLGGKIAVVTGSAQGFGKGIAEELYREGACVVIADLNEPLAKEVAASLGECAIAVKADVSSEESVAGMIAACVEAFGGLDLFVSNAGVLKAGSLDEMEKKDFRVRNRHQLHRVLHLRQIRPADHARAVCGGCFVDGRYHRDQQQIGAGGQQ